MVLLTMTPSIVEGLKVRDDAVPGPSEESAAAHNEPSLDAPAPGKPISHGQILDLWRHLREDNASYTLENLLLGTRVHIPPPPPKPEPTPEYKALMARLRREEEARAYERMLNPPDAPPIPTNAPFDPYAAVHRAPDADGADDDGIAVVAREMNQQLMVVLNILLSVFGTAAAVWFAARWWSAAARVLLSLGAAIFVAIADVVIFYGFVGRVRDGRKGKGKEEVREVVGTWVVGGEGEEKGRGEGESDMGAGAGEPGMKPIEEATGGEKTNLRRRNRPPS